MRRIVVCQLIVVQSLSNPGFYPHLLIDQPPERVTPLPLPSGSPLERGKTTGKSIPSPVTGGANGIPDGRAHATGQTLTGRWTQKHPSCAFDQRGREREERGEAEKAVDAL